MQIDLNGHIALVTGGSGELGRAISRTLAACGAAVAVHYHSNQARAEAVRDDIVASGGRAMVVAADVTERDAVAALRDAVAEDLGAPDIVVANAVIQYQWTSVLAQAEADYEGQFRSCVMQMVHLAKAFAPAMIEAGWGRFVAINTECAMQCWPNQSAYASGKRGLDGVVRVLAKEIGPKGVTVNQVAPGWMISDKFRDNDDHAEYSKQYAARVPLRRRGEDTDIANAVAFLASDLARFITGCYLPVCGGNEMPTI